MRLNNPISDGRMAENTFVEKLRSVTHFTCFSEGPKSHKTRAPKGDSLGGNLGFFFSEMLVMICLVHDDCRKKDQS